MQTKSKILIIVTFMLLGVGLVTIINIALNFRDYSLKSAVDKSKMAASIVKDGLTAHMVNGMMDKREYYLDQISKNDNIKKLWIVRSQNVIKQYGNGFNDETVRDAIDKEVISTGKMVKQTTENAKGITLRVTIPYKAINDSTTKCLQCHNVKKGAILGAISMEFDISDMRLMGAITISKILGINLLFIIIVLLLINRYVAPYTTLFANLKEVIDKAYEGDFSHQVNANVSGEAKELVDHMNTLFSKMQETFGDIKYNLATFIPSNSATYNDPLQEANIIISELSDIYKFKKTIELDISKEVIYGRLVDILYKKYKIKHFALYEVDTHTKVRTLIHITSGESICLESSDKDCNNCRAFRTKSDIISTEFSDLCRGCDAKGCEYICIPFDINQDASLVISMTTKNKEEINRVNALIPSIKHYFEAAKPVVESRILMDKLRDTSLRDGMTGLYNRRFLEEFIDKVMSQALRENETYSVMMLDVDWFKMVNDTYGHDVGDKVIVAIGKLLRESIRDSDLAIRYGGEEFVVMLHNANEEGTKQVAHKIHSGFSSLVFDVGNGETIQKTMSIGVAKFPTDGDSIWKCIKYADTALYVAKTTGRNKIVNYSQDMSEDEHTR